MAHSADNHAHGPSFYWKIYWTLLALFSVSVAGPFVGEALNSKAITLFTAFGIAFVKAYLVAANFMHLNVEKKYVTYLLLTAVAFMALFYAGVSPDVMNHRGRQWENVAAQREVDRAMTAAKAAEAGGGHGHGEHGGH